MYFKNNIELVSVQLELTSVITLRSEDEYRTESVLIVTAFAPMSGVPGVFISVAPFKRPVIRPEVVAPSWRWIRGLRQGYSTSSTNWGDVYWKICHVLANIFVT